MLRLLLTAFVVTAANAAHAQTQLQTFAKRHDAESFIGIEEIQANPFVYADKNYMLRLQFVRMAGLGGAVFTGPSPSGSAQIYLIKVPSKAFSGGEQLIATVRVIGYDEASPFPEVELVGFEICKTPNCSEFER